MRLFWLCFLAGLALTAVAVAIFWWLGELDGMRLSLHGWIALAAGTILSFAVGSALMAILFASARRGYDERGGGGPSSRE